MVVWEKTGTQSKNPPWERHPMRLQAVQSWLIISLTPLLSMLFMDILPVLTSKSSLRNGSPFFIHRNREVLYFSLDQTWRDAGTAQLPLNEGQVLSHDCPLVPFDKVGQQLHRRLGGCHHGVTKFDQPTTQHSFSMLTARQRLYQVSVSCIRNT